MEDLKIFDENGKALHIADVIARFLKSKAEQHKTDANKLLIDLNYDELRLERYDEGAYEKWKVLETLKERF